MITRGLMFGGAPPNNARASPLSHHFVDLDWPDISLKTRYLLDVLSATYTM